MPPRPVIEYLRYGLSEVSASLFSRYYVENVLPLQSDFQRFNCDDAIARLEDLPRYSHGERIKETQYEREVLIDTFEALGITSKWHPNLNGKEVDHAIFKGERFANDFSNTVGIVEAERPGKLRNQYYIKEQSNRDPIYQLKSYLRDVNNQLANHGSTHSVPFGLLVDGDFWRIYSRNHTHSNREFEQHFLEFRLSDILDIKSQAERHRYLKLFVYLIGMEGWQSHLTQTSEESRNYGRAVSQELRIQVFTALEMIATGLWRQIQGGDINLLLILKEYYAIDMKTAQTAEGRTATLKVVYEESLVILLRLLFILQAEDRRLLERTIKRSGGLVDYLIRSEHPIGRVTLSTTAKAIGFDRELAEAFTTINERYNGGLFDDHKHALLAKFDIDDTLFAGAIDNLCRISVKGQLLAVDFGDISVRELGTIYEGLLEYKLAVVEEDHTDRASLADRTKKRYDVKAGDLELRDYKGERKASGSYYTPDSIVEYLVERTVAAQINQIVQTEPDPDQQIERILELKICDPAMGSGHFLVAAFEVLTSAIGAIIERYELDRNLAELKMEIARRCLYGVDLNPVAVDIAKMVLWIKLFDPARPLEFFDPNLVVGNSLIGENAGDPEQENSAGTIAMLRSQIEQESDVLATLERRFAKLQAMPRHNADQVRSIESYYGQKIAPLKLSLTYLYNLKLIRYFIPERQADFVTHYDNILGATEQNLAYLTELVVSENPAHKAHQRLAVAAQAITDIHRPVHWKVEFAHVFLHGGFDVVLGNPPWEISKANHNHFFSDRILGYANLETVVAKRQATQLMRTEPLVAEKYREYLTSIERQNDFFKDGYRWQVVTDSAGTQLSGDQNLYKVFLEKAASLLAPGGRCGFVVPSGLNTDKGASGLRRMLLTEHTVEELIMFENRRGIFPAVHRQYKFDVLTFRNQQPNQKTTFTTGFYWLDPAWLVAGDPAEPVAPRLLETPEAALHERFPYPTHLSQKLSPEMNALIEVRAARDIPILERIAAHPLFGDTTQGWHGEVYNEFHMTNDAELFNVTGSGYPLMEGKTIHQFTAGFSPPTRFVDSSRGAERLAAKWRLPIEQLPHRGYRIGFRAIASATNNRTLISAILPPHRFCGNSINLIRLVNLRGNEELGGVVAILNSLVIDYLLRFRVSSNVNAFYVKELPVLRDTATVKRLGQTAMPLFAGKEFAALRGEYSELPLSDEPARNALRARLDAEVATLYGLGYEELQHVLTRFPLVDDEYKQDVLRAFRKRSGD